MMETSPSMRQSVAGTSAARTEATTVPKNVAYAAVFLRVALGVWFLLHEFFLEKISTWTAKTLPGTFATWIKNPAGYGFYQSFLHNVALPNAEFFRTFITSWEFIFGICLILGLGLRVLVPLQIFANLNYIMVKT